jgi:hypothetical protein
MLGGFLAGANCLAAVSPAAAASQPGHKPTHRHKRVHHAAPAASAASEAADAAPADAAPALADDPHAPPYAMKAGAMQCDDHLALDVEQADSGDQTVTLTWKGRHYHLTRETTTSGAYHFGGAALVMIQIPSKSMLFDKSSMTRLADDCNPVVASQ